MGKLRKRYNWKSRQVVETICNDTDTNKISLDLDVKRDEYDSCNALVLPSKKRKVTKVKDKEAKTITRLLSKKQRKKLEKVVEVKKRKQNRAEIIADLQKVQATEEELNLMTSVTTMQTKGIKRCFVEPRASTKAISASDLNSLKGMRKEPIKKAKIATTVIGFSESSESSDDDEAEIPVTEATEITGNSEDHPKKEICVPTPERQSEVIKPSEACSVKGKEDSVRIPVTHVPIRRDPEVQKSRLALPILGEEQQIMETISDNSIIILCGETGSGKTTQVPQFLYEAGYASDSKRIGITEPRRIAAVAMSKRVATEMNLDSRNVSYQIRYEGNVTEETRIKFMTDGVLLREIQKDFLLTRYKVVIIDEAHERSMYSDILIGLLSRIIPLRCKNGNPLKLIIMSATLRVEDFTQNARLFKTPPPVINIDSRQYPVTVHFNKRTPMEDYIAEAFRKVCKIHRKLPEGGILVFVTGVNEVNSLCRKLRNAFSHPQRIEEQKDDGTRDVEKDGDENEFTGKELSKRSKTKRQKEKTNSNDAILPQINLDDYSINPIDEEQLCEQNIELSLEEDDISDDDDIMTSAVDNRFTEPLHVLPLYSMLAPNRQSKIFQPPPEGSRLCVVATNVAETSLTLPNIKYVVDTGKVKMRVYDKVTGVSAFLVTWTSKASANQRAGRAGRTGPGHCYRLYSSAVFVDQFPDFSEPEIARRPFDDLVLQMKSMGIDKVVNFPFPTPPSEEALKASENRLKLFGALEDKTKSSGRKSEWNSKITPLGRAMACFPISPRYAKMLALSHQHDLLPYTIAIVSALTVQEVFLDSHLTEQPKSKSSKWNEIKKTWAGQGNSLRLGDVTILLKAVGASEFNGCTPKFCDVHGLRLKALKEIRKLRIQLTNEVNLAIPGSDIYVDPKMTPPTESQSRLMRQLVLTGTIDRVARKVPLAEVADEEKSKKKYSYQCLEVDDPVYIHPQSVLHKENCEFVVYQEIVETSKLYMRIVTAIEPEWLAIYTPSQCRFSKPLDEPKPRYDSDGDKLLCHANATFGKWAWTLPTVELEFPECLDKYRWFAFFLLEGEICLALKKYRKVMLSPPTTLTKSWFKLHQPSEKLLLALAELSVSSKEKLKERWNEDKRYLLAEYKLWLPEIVHFEVEKKWPPDT